MHLLIDEALGASFIDVCELAIGRCVYKSWRFCLIRCKLLAIPHCCDPILMSHHSQFQLLRQQRFAPFFATMALGALNDKSIRMH